MKKFIASLFFLLLTLSLPLQAENKQYNIEIVIFEDTSSRYINSEQWPVILPPDDESTENESKKPAKNNVVNITHHPSDALARHVDRLKRSSRYNVLLHQSWQQAGLNDTDAISIAVDTTHNTKKINIAVYDPSRQSQPDTKSSVQGSLKLILGRYLHIHTDLIYKRSSNLNSQTVPISEKRAFSEFKIKSQRRMRSKELHYIDHPLLGMLVTVVPIEVEDKEVTE